MVLEEQLHDILSLKESVAHLTSLINCEDIVVETEDDVTEDDKKKQLFLLRNLKQFLLSMLTMLTRLKNLKVKSHRVEVDNWGRERQW